MFRQTLFSKTNLVIAETQLYYCEEATLVGYTIFLIFCTNLDFMILN
jgi:hypothetical protein